MYIANFFVQGEVTHSGLPQWLSETIGMDGQTPDAARINIWINSEGGDLLAAIEAINLMAMSSIPITTIINGSAESAALLIAMAGHRRLVMKNAWGMGHHFSTQQAGNYHDLMDSVKHNELLDKTMKDLFIKYTGMDEATITEHFLGRGTTWLSSEDLVKFGIVDEIVEPSPALLEKLRENGKKKETNKN